MPLLQMVLSFRSSVSFSVKEDIGVSWVRLLEFKGGLHLGSSLTSSGSRGCEK